MLKKSLFLATLLLLSVSYVEAGIVKFSAKHVVKPAAKGSVKVVKAVSKVAFKAAV